MKIAIASDHGGFELKEQLKKYLEDNKYDIVDVGTYSLDSCHYPEFAVKCAKKVQSGECQFGIIVQVLAIIQPSLALCVNTITQTLSLMARNSLP